MDNGTGYRIFSSLVIYSQSAIAYFSTGKKKRTGELTGNEKKCIFARSFEKGKLAERLKAAVSKTARV